MSYTAKDWDQVRVAFATSIMVDTPLTSLAQNLEGPAWPIDGRDETPAAYIDLSYAEAQETLVAKGLEPRDIQRLIAILKETLAFDTPFGEMVEQSAAAAERDNPLLKNLARLQIPENFPIAFTALSEGTLDFCRLENLTTVGQFAVFAQNISQSVIVGGDFRALLNALSHVDEASLAKFLPFRPGQKGVHLIEALGHVVRQLPFEQRAGLSAKTPQISPALNEMVTALMIYFNEEKKHLSMQMVAGTPVARMAIVLNDPALEPAVVALLTPALKAALPTTSPTVSTLAAPKPKKSWLARLFSRS